MPDIALGMQPRLQEVFAASVNGLHMDQWEAHGLYDQEEIDGSWGLAFELTLTRSIESGGHFHFDLTGLRIAEALVGAPNPDEWVHCHACWELRQIIRNGDWFRNTSFYLDDRLLTPDQVIALGIVLQE